MKKAVLYILLFSYTSLLLQPLLPYIADATAHAFWYSQHMATVHYQNGKYHVHKESVSMAKKSNSENTNSSGQKKSLNENDHLVYSLTGAAPTLLKLRNHCLLTYTSPHDGHLQTNYPPPKV